MLELNSKGQQVLIMFGTEAKLQGRMDREKVMFDDASLKEIFDAPILIASFGC